MRANVRILEFMVNYWDHDMGMFNLQGETLELTEEDIYFITGLSRRGAPVNLEGTSRGGDPLSVQNSVEIFCTPGTQRRGTNVPIEDIQDFTLQVLASTIVRLAGSTSLHLATRNQMRVAVDYFRGALYDWCSGVTPIMRRQLSDCKRGRHKNFGYASIMVTFFFFESTSLESCYTSTDQISTSAKAEQVGRHLPPSRRRRHSTQCIR